MPAQPQNGQPNGVVTGAGRSGAATGASQRGHASVPDAMRVVRKSRRSSFHPEPPRTGSGSSGEDPLNPRCRLTQLSVARRPGGVDHQGAVPCLAHLTTGGRRSQPAARAHAMQRTLSGIACSRGRPIGPPHSSHTP